MQIAFNWFYTFISNQIAWLFSLMVVPNVSLGALIVVFGVSSLAVSNLMLIAKR